MKIGDRLKSLRLGNGLTQEQLAKKVNLSKANISKYESEDLEPNIATLGIFAEIFNVSVDWILGRTSDRTAHDKNPKLVPEIKWGDFGISFYEGNGKKLTQKQKDKITKLVQIAVMDDDYYWGDEEDNNSGDK